MKLDQPIQHQYGALSVWLPRLSNIYFAPNFVGMFHWNMSRTDARKLLTLENMLVVDSVHFKDLRLSCFNVFDEVADPSKAEGVNVRCMSEKRHGKLAVSILVLN